jgi:hypothetical protein
VIDDKYRLLTHRAIDGELTEPERAELDRYLASSAEARHFYQQVEAFASIPSHLPQVEAPASIRAEVLHRIARGQHESRSRKSNPRGIGALIGSLLTPRLAYGLAAGLIIGIAIGATTFKQPGNQLDPLDVSGTILGGKESGVLTRLDADAFSDEQMRGQLSVDTKGDLTYLQVELQSSQELSIVIDFDPNAYVFRAFEQRSPQPSGLVTGQGQIRSSHAGENRYLFVFGTVGKAASPVVLRVESTGVSYQRELTFGDEAGS